MDSSRLPATVAPRPPELAPPIVGAPEEFVATKVF